MCTCSNSIWNHFSVALRIRCIWSQKFFSQFPSVALSLSCSRAALDFFVCLVQNNVLSHWRCVLGLTFSSWNATRFVFTNKPRLFHTIIYATLNTHSCYSNVFSFSVSCKMWASFFYVSGMSQKFSRMNCGKLVCKWMLPTGLNKTDIAEMHPCSICVQTTTSLLPGVVPGFLLRKKYKHTECVICILPKFIAFLKILSWI